MAYRFDINALEGITQENAPDGNTQYIVFAILALAERVERVAEVIVDLRGP